MGEGYEVDPQDLEEAAAGVHAVFDALTPLGVVEGMPGQGRGVAVLPALAGPIGHDGLARALAGFCARWEWGVRAAVQTGRDMAGELTETAHAYTAGDRHPAGLLGRLYADLAGDPGADPATAQDATWDELTAPRPENVGDVLGAAGDAWVETGQDLLATSAPGMVWAALTGKDPLAAARRDLDALLHGS